MWPAPAPLRRSASRQGTAPSTTPRVRILAAAGVLLTLGLLATSGRAQARELQGRLGLGYNAEFANFEQPGGVPGVSLKYGMTRDIAAEVIVGMSTATPSNSVTAAKLFKNLFLETNLNFYFMLGAGVVGADNRSGGQFLTGFGAEFFIPGVESLGLSMETGVSADSLGGSFALKTLGVSFLNAGMHFYF